MTIEEFNSLTTEKQISYAAVHESVAWREMPLRWFYILNKVDDFYVELTYDEFKKDRLAVGARAIPANIYEYLLKRNYYSACIDLDGLENLFDS